MPAPLVAAAAGAGAGGGAAAGGGLFGTATFSLRVSGMQKSLGQIGQFGKTVGQAMGKAKEGAGQAAQSVQKLTAGFGQFGKIVSGVFTEFIRNSTLAQGVLGALQQILDAMLSGMLAAFVPIWGELIKLFTELVVDVLPEMMDMFGEFASVIGDVFLPLIREFEPEWKLLLKIFLGIVGSGLLVFFVTLAAALVVVGTTMRAMGLIWEALAGVFQTVWDILVGILDTLGEIADAVGGVVGIAGSPFEFNPIGGNPLDTALTRSVGLTPVGVDTGLAAGGTRGGGGGNGGGVNITNHFHVGGILTTRGPVFDMNDLVEELNRISNAEMAGVLRRRA